MNHKISNRQFLSAAIIVFYLIPLLFFSAYSIKLMSHHKSWALLSLGLLLIVLGTLSLIFLISYWEQSLRERKSIVPLPLSQSPSLFLSQNDNKVTKLDPSLDFTSHSPDDSTEVENCHQDIKELNLLQTALQCSQKQQEELMTTLEGKVQELQRLEEENCQLQTQALQIAQDFADYKLFSEEQLKQKQLQLTNLQQNLEDQRSEMEKRQEQIHQLDSKVHDLSYEIKTLLHLHHEEVLPLKESLPRQIKTFSSILEDQFDHHLPMNAESREAFLDEKKESLENEIQNPHEAALLLKKCIQIAQKLTGTNYYSNESSRYREFSSSFFAIDQRRLFDSLRGEKGALLMIFSQKDYKPLFVNNESKALLGWSPEKFLSDFPSIMQEGIQDWKKALHHLSIASEAQARLLAKTRQGQERVLSCHLGIIPSGLFRNYAIGVLYPT